MKTLMIFSDMEFDTANSNKVIEEKVDKSTNVITKLYEQTATPYEQMQFIVENDSSKVEE